MFSTMFLSEISLLSAFVGVVSVLLLVKISFNVVHFWIAPYQSTLRKLPGPPSKHWYFGWTTRDVIENLTGNISRMHARYGPVFYGRGVHRASNLYITDEVAINYIFQNECSTRNPELFRRSPLTGHAISVFFGSTLFGVEEDVHRRQRRAMLPAFTESAIRQVSSVMYEITQDLIAIMRKDLEGKAEEDVQIDALPYVRDATLDVVGRAGFGRELGGLNRTTNELNERLIDLQNMLTDPSPYALLRIRFPWIRHFGKYLSEEEAKFSFYRTGKDAYADELVNNAEQEVKEGSTEDRNILRLIKHASANSGNNGINHTELREFVPILLLAGFETTSTTITWAIHCLTRDASGLKRQARLRDELNKDEFQGWQSDFTVLNGMPYLDGICIEVFRLYPVVGVLDRMCWQDTIIPLSKPITLQDGTIINEIPIKRGERVYISTGSVNRNKSIWGENANEFLPERWLGNDHIYFENNLSSLNNSQLGGWNHMTTFGQGIRMCLGFRFALAEFKILLANCIANFDWKAALDPNTGRPIEIQARGQNLCKAAIKGAEVNRYSLPVLVEEIK